MKKYVFIDQGIGNAFKFIAEELGIEDFDKQIKENFEQKTPYVSIYQDDEEKPAFTISPDLFESVEVYDPNGWNSRGVTPPQVIAGLRYSDPYLVENAMGYYLAAIFDFHQNAWLDSRDLDIVTCSRFREVPVGFFGE